MRRRLVVLLAAAVVQLGGSLVLYCEGSPEVALNEMVVVSGGVSPRVAYGLSREKAALTVTVSVASFQTPATGEGIGLQLGLAANKAMTLSEKDAQLRTTSKP